MCVWRWRREEAGVGGSQAPRALINDRVRAVTQKGRAEEQPRPEQPNCPPCGGVENSRGLDSAAEPRLHGPD